MERITDIETVEDKGHDREEWIPFFQTLESREELQDENYPGQLRQEFQQVGTQEFPTGAGVRTPSYDQEEGPGSIHLEWGSTEVEQSLMAEGRITFFDPDFSGEPVTEKYRELLENQTAPYFDGDPNFEFGGFEQPLKVPLDYDQEDWEETVDTAVTLFEKAQAYQNALHETSDDYDFQDTR